MATTFKFGNGNWAVKEDYALAYNDENGNFKPLPFDFTRASTATRVNKDGLIENVPSGKPRIDFLNNSKGHLLLEPSRKNDLTYSEFTNADPVGWTLGFGTGTYDYDLVSYKGRGALKQTQTTSGRSYQYQNVTLLASTTYTLSMYVDISNSNVTNSGEDIMHVIADDDTGDNTAEWQDIDTNTGRVSITFTTGSDTSVQIRIGLGVTGNTLAPNQVLVYSMPQLEAGSYATSYIPTEGSSVTRSAETLVQSNIPDIFNRTAMSVYMEIEALSDDSTNREITISDGSSSDRYVVKFTSSDTINTFTISNLGSTGYSATTTADNPSITQFNKIGVSFNSSVGYLYVNGTEIESDTVSNVIGDDLTKISFANAALNNNFFYGKIKDLRVYDTALSDSELQALTSN